MTDLQKNHYKEKKPEETVTYLQDLLKKYGIEVEETWVDKSYIDTFSLRLNFKGTTKGTNGKGVTREYAQASAYAELFERYQNGVLINPRFIPKDKSRYNYLVSADEKYLTAEQIVAQNDSFMEMYFERRNMTTADFEKKVSAFFEVNKLDYLISGYENRYVALPFYSYRDKKVNYLPHWVYCMYYGSNGMSAGNTPEEAIVQGLSEIIERYVHKALFFLDGGLPDVPDKYIQKYPELYERYLSLKNVPGFDVRIKDCSLGGKYPVVGLVILQKNTCRYGIKLGCHPDFGIALERTLTEAAQGTDIVEYVNRSYIDFFNTGVTDWINMTNSFKVGLSQYPYQLFSDNLAYKFTKPKDVSASTNKSLCDEMIRNIVKEGYDILIRDVSTLGFPSYHIIIPGMSELIDASDDKIRASNTRAFVSALIQNPKQINVENCKYVIASLGYYSKSLMENGLESYYQDTSDFTLPYSEIGGSAIYLASMCHVLVGDYMGAYQKYTLIERHAQHGNLPEGEKNKIKCISAYLSGMSVMKKHSEVMKYLYKLFDKDICTEIDSLFSDNRKVIVKQFPNITNSDKTAEAMERIYAYADILKKEQINAPIDQMQVANIFA